MSYGSAGAFSGYSVQSGARRRSTPWTPANLGSKLYIRFNPGSLSLADNDPIASWTGTGAEIVTVTASGTERPTFRTGGDGGLSYAQFDGSNDIMQATLANDVLKFYYDEGITFLSSILRDASDNASTRRTIFGTGNDSNHPQAEAGGSFAVSLVTPGVFIASVSTATLADRILAIYRTSNSVALAYAEINGTVETASFASTGAPGTTPSTWTFMLGARGVGSQHFYGHIYDACWVRGEATLAEREQYAGWAAWSRGRQADLPAGHPYKSAPPTV